MTGLKTTTLRLLRVNLHNGRTEAVNLSSAQWKGQVFQSISAGNTLRMVSVRKERENQNQS